MQKVYIMNSREGSLEIEHQGFTRGAGSRRLACTHDWTNGLHRSLGGTSTARITLGEPERHP